MSSGPARAAEFALLAAVSLAVLALLDRLDPAVHAITLGDETVYLQNGLELGWRAFDNYEAFPLHSLGYRLLATLVADPIDLYKVGSAIGFGALVLLATLVLHELSGLSLAAFLLASALVADPLLGLAVAPFPQRTALVVVLAGTWIASRIRDPLRRALPLGLAFFAAAFARAEYVLSFYAVSLGIVAGGLLRGRDRRDPRAVGLYAALVAGLSLIAEFPLLAGSERSLMAFGQHYAIQQQEAGLSVDPGTQWREVLTRDFGSAASIQGALRANPRAFLGHLAWSARELGEWAGGLHPLTALLVLASLALTAVGLVRRWRGRAGADPAGMVLLLVLLIGAAPVAASAVVIAPREHYMQQLYVWIALLGAASAPAVLPRAWWQPGLRSRLALLAVAAAFVLLVPGARAERDFVAENARALRELVAVDGGQPPRVFSMFLRFSVYVDPGCEELFFSRWSPRESGLREFLAAERIDLVLLNDERIAVQPPPVRAGLEAFLADPATHGFRPLHADERLHAFARAAP